MSLMPSSDMTDRFRIYFAFHDKLAKQRGMMMLVLLGGTVKGHRHFLFLFLGTLPNWRQQKSLKLLHCTLRVQIYNFSVFQISQISYRLYCNMWSVTVQRFLIPGCQWSRWAFSCLKAWNQIILSFIWPFCIIFCMSFFLFYLFLYCFLS